MTYGDWTITWSGWREPSNQPIVIGYWLAFKAAAPEPFWCATTMGTLREHRSWFECIDFTRQPDWPMLTSVSTDNEREANRQRALQLLTAKLMELGS